MGGIGPTGRLVEGAKNGYRSPVMSLPVVKYCRLFLLFGGVVGASWGDRVGPGDGFTHGVASGDPRHESVLLWTRFVPPDGRIAKVRWELASDSRFRSMVASGTAKSDAERDYCVKAVATGLVPGSTYFYRFCSRGRVSSVGRTRTLPQRTERVRIGVVNCGKFTGGYYHAYRAVADEPTLDVVIHLGDYIYDNGPTRPGDSYYRSFERTGRQHQPPRHCVTLQDYRTRYAQYRGDPDLRYLHAQVPLIAIWDDHDVAAIPRAKTAEGLPDYASDWMPRFRDSLRAWHEWVPSRVPLGKPIYRSFVFGDLVTLLMVDTRVCCKSRVDKSLDSLEDPDRHIVGDAQLDWMFNQITNHHSAWNVMGNQLLVAEKGAGWNRWHGFPVDRNRLVRFFEERPDCRLLVTTGNAHNPHHYEVPDSQGRTLFHEVLPGSVSSGNNAEKARYDQSKLDEIERAQSKNPGLVWVDNNAHGYIVLDIDRNRARVEWKFVSDIRKPSFTVRTARTLTIPTQAPAECGLRGR